MITNYNCNYYELNNENKVTKVTDNFIKKIFSNVEEIELDKIVFTVESIYSSSRSKGSKRLLDIISKYYDTNNIVITDGTANIGTDSINIANNFLKINAVELCKINYDALKTNIKTFNLEKKIFHHNADINKKIKDLEQDIIYIDAPWGGPNYKNNETVDLFLGEINIIDFYLQNKNRADTFIFKVPNNFNFVNLFNRVNDKIYKHSYKKGSIIKYYLIVIKKNNII